MPTPSEFARRLLEKLRGRVDGHCEALNDAALFGLATGRRQLSPKQDAHHVLGHLGEAASGHQARDLDELRQSRIANPINHSFLLSGAA